MTLTTKQKEVFNCYRHENPKILICSGAKRAGKTFVLNLIFLTHIARYKNMGLSFIIGGAIQSSIRRNILDDLEKILGKELRLDKSNAVEIFGNKVYCFDGANADSWKKARGFTAAGALLNEATALHDTFIKEVISRCSYEGARVFMDTNPENPAHTVKKDYIDKTGQKLKNGQLNIKAFHFTLFDNDKLDLEYVESIVASTPSGMFTDRDIYGRWVAAEGVVYKDFNQKVHYIDSIENINFKSYFAGVDWGYEHFGSIVVIGEDDENNFYLLNEIARQHEEIDFWVDEAKKIKTQYGNILFYCDTARPEHIQRFRKEGIRAKNADKAVLSGIEVVAKLFKQNRLFVYRKEVERFKEEIFMYVWNEKTGEPVKQFDDVLDALRYAIYTESKDNAIEFLK
ncbi:phage terminase, large subunit, PBSX family [Gottschalkia purinilytica]|uniref:Phage terminase, large subunit, PBSX family n=1 Tax=Gottschalkia purinilytica TaxID=1503 RepID=A0A0L0W6K5_GOTPU|nr:PBSX family phage terminase large subunit [Gottschalkia purinilytica]KNF07159.1 phage terminase, large subunit, PBSX family [Gottschalkia purinilytica]